MREVTKEEFYRDLLLCLAQTAGNLELHKTPGFVIQEMGFDKTTWCFLILGVETNNIAIPDTKVSYITLRLYLLVNADVHVVSAAFCVGCRFVGMGRRIIIQYRAGKDLAGQSANRWAINKLRRIELDTRRPDGGRDGLFDRCAGGIRLLDLPQQTLP